MFFFILLLLLRGYLDIEFRYVDADDALTAGVEWSDTGVLVAIFRCCWSRDLHRHGNDNTPLLTDKQTNNWCVISERVDEDSLTNSERV